METPDFDIHLPEGEADRIARSRVADMQPSVLLMVDGEMVALDTVKIKSSFSRNRLARSWAKSHKIDADEARKRLESLSVALLGSQQSSGPTSGENVALRRSVDVASAFLDRLDITHRRKLNKVYCAAAEVEILTSDIHKLATVEEVDQVEHTMEGQESKNQQGRVAPLTRSRLFADAVARVLTQRLPNIEDIETGDSHDPTINFEKLRSKLGLVLLKIRTIRDGAVPSAGSIIQWAFSIAPDTGWVAMPSFPVAGKMDKDASSPSVGVKSDWLVGEMGYTSAKRLSLDLKACGFIKPGNNQIRIGGQRWRVWIITQSLIEEHQQKETGESDDENGDL